MDPEALSEYLSRVATGHDDDAFHSLIEAGEEAVSLVRAAASAKASDAQFERLVGVLREIRTDSSFNALRNFCTMPFSRKWVIAAEGLFHNDPGAASRALKELVQEAALPEREAKAKIVAEMISSVEPPGA